MRRLVPAFALLPGTVCAQKASYTFIGPGCRDKANAETVPFFVVGTPKLGGSFVTASSARDSTVRSHAVVTG